MVYFIVSDLISLKCTITTIHGHALLNTRKEKKKKKKKSVQSDFSYSLIFVIENIKYKIHFVVEMQFLLQTQNN